MIDGREMMSEVKNAVIAYCESVAPEFEQKALDEYAKFPASLGQADIDSEVRARLKSEISLILKAIGQKALIAEFGKGSLMDRNNPALPRYQSSHDYNPNRLDGEIRSRPKGIYYDLDGIPHKGTGGNKILEGKSERFNPIEPRHIVRELLKEELNRFTADLTAYIATQVNFYKLVDGLEVKVTI